MSGGNIARRAGEQAAKAVGGVRTTDINLPGVGGSRFLQDGSVELTTDPQAQQNQRMLQALGTSQGEQALDLAPGVSQFGQQALSTSDQLLQEASGFDPLGAAETRFNRLRGVLEEGRNEQRQAQEERLFRQGRLDSVGRGQSSAQTKALEGAFAREDAMMLDRQFQEAEQARQAALQGGLQSGAAGVTTQQSGFQQALQAQPAQEQVATAPIRTALASQTIAANESARRAAASNALSGHNTVVAANGGGGSLGGAVGGAVLGGIAGSIVPGVGTMAGAQLGAGLGSFL